MLLAVRRPPHHEACHTEVQFITTFTKAGLAIISFCGGMEILDYMTGNKAVFNLMWEELAKGKDKYQYGLEILAAHDRLVAADSKILKAGWQPAFKNIKVIEVVHSGENMALSEGATIGGGATSGGGATTRRPPVNPNPTLEEQIAAIDPNLTPDQHAAEVRRIKHNKTSREFHRRARASRRNSIGKIS